MIFSELMMKGLDLLVLGMGTVFVFLALMVTAVTLMSKLARRIEAMTADPLAADGPPKEHIAAITAAIHQYRTNRSP